MQLKTDNTLKWRDILEIRTKQFYISILFCNVLVNFTLDFLSATIVIWPPSLFFSDLGLSCFLPMNQFVLKHEFWFMQFQQNLRIVFIVDDLIHRINISQTCEHWFINTIFFQTFGWINLFFLYENWFINTSHMNRFMPSLFEF
jgi:hypothetical protein